jgi:SAM-dependent methyltransferase
MTLKPVDPSLPPSTVSALAEAAPELAIASDLDGPMRSAGAGGPAPRLVPAFGNGHSPFAGRTVLDTEARIAGERRWRSEPEDDSEYEGVMAEVYDLWFQQGEVFEDTEFFYEHVKAQDGPALDVGCGSGRLLIPFLQHGLDVEGLDASKDMLRQCEERAGAFGLSPRLHCQYMQDLDLPRSYHCIYIPFCSFQLLTNRADARKALERFHAHLVPGGKLLVTNYIPWKHMHAEHEWRLRRVARRPSDGASVLMHEATSCDRHQQIQTDWVRYEIYQHGKLAETYLRTLRMRWYHPHEFQLMAENAGFHGFRTYGDYTSEPANDEHGSIVFEAVR